MCAQEAICVLRLLATFLRHPLKVGFDVRISLVCMSKGCFPAGGRFHCLLSSYTSRLLAGNSLLVIQKGKLLHMNS